MNTISGECRAILLDSYFHQIILSNLCTIYIQHAQKVKFGGRVQLLILFLATAGRDDRRCGEIINLHIESRAATNHNQTNSNSTFYSTYVHFRNVPAGFLCVYTHTHTERSGAHRYRRFCRTGQGY